jgi:ribosomal protein L7Ae-like RNA K-turn-binding protein
MWPVRAEMLLQGRRYEVDSQSERRLLGLVGLGLRARNAVVGVARVREAARRRRLELAIVAHDASRHSLAKVVPLLVAKGVAVVVGPDASRLGYWAGRQSIAVLGITDRALARGIAAVVRGVEARPVAGSTRKQARSMTGGSEF